MQDLAQLRRYVSLDAAYTDARRVRASMLISESEAAAGKLTAAEFELRVERVAALADNGHSAVWHDDRWASANRIPARLGLLADGVFIVRGRGSAAQAVGTRVDEIDGVPIADVLQRLRIYRGGANNLRDYDNVDMLESPELLHAAGIARSDQEVTFSVTDHDAHKKQIKLSAFPPRTDKAQVPGLRYLAPLPIADEDPEWRSSFQNSPTPFWLREPDRAFRLAPMPDLRAVYLQFKTNTDAEDGERIKTFISEARRFIESYRPQNIILDMRFNGGGDYTKTASFMADLPKLIPEDGRIFVITHAATFSAGITSIGFVKQAAPRRTTIVGEPIGDRLVFYGEPRHLILRNSGIGMNYSTGLHDYLHGCGWFGGCYWVNWIYPIAVETLDPDLTAPQTFEAVLAGRDPALEAVCRSLGTSRSACVSTEF